MTLYMFFDYVFCVQCLKNVIINHETAVADLNKQVAYYSKEKLIISHHQKYKN